MKRYINSAVIYSVIAMILGVFYREFTKFNNFTGKTSLSVMHTHYFALGMIFFILLILLEKNFTFSNKKTNCLVAVYHIGLNISGATFLVRGIIQVLNITASSALNASISGIAGIGHILLGVSLVMILLQIRKSILK